MTYQEAKKIKVGDVLYAKPFNYKSTTVLRIRDDTDAKVVFFGCTDGAFRHTAVISASTDELAKLYIESPKTRVFINHNNELGEWRYAVEVVDSDGFWLDSFKTYDEALGYTEQNNLTVVESH